MFYSQKSTEVQNGVSHEVITVRHDVGEEVPTLNKVTSFSWCLVALKQCKNTLDVSLSSYSTLIFYENILYKNIEVEFGQILRIF